MMAPETNVQTNQKTNTSVGVNVTTETQCPIGDPVMNLLHFKTIPGLLKIIQLVLGIICMACASPVRVGYVHFFMFVVAICFISTISQCFLHLFSLQKMIPLFPWSTLELFSNGCAVLLYAVATIVQLCMTTRRDYHLALSFHGSYSPYVAAGVMALFNTLAYAALTLFLFKDYKSPTSPTPAVTAPNGNA